MYTRNADYGKLHCEKEKSQRTFEVLQDKLRCKVSALNKLVCVSSGTKIFKQKYSLFSQTISVSGNITPADKTKFVWDSFSEILELKNTD